METIRIISGYPAQEKTNSSRSYENTPRHKIFTRDAPGVNSPEEMQFLMRYNDYLHDKFGSDESGQPEPGNAISSRYDMREGDRRLCFGGFDNKIGIYNKVTKNY